MQAQGHLSAIETAAPEAAPAEGWRAPDGAPAEPAPGKSPSKDPGKKKHVRLLLWVFAGAVLFCASSVGLVGALLYFDIERHPLVGDFVRDRLTAVLQDQIDPAFRLSIDRVNVHRQSEETIVDISDVRIRDAAGRALIHAPAGRVRLATGPLLRLRFVPTSITLSGLRADIEISDAGEVVTRSGADSAPAPATLRPPPQVLEPAPLPLRVKRFVGDAFGALAVIRQAVGGRLPDIGVEDVSLSVNDRRLDHIFRLDKLAGRLKAAEDGAVTARLAFAGQGSPIAVNFALTPPLAGVQKLSAHAQGDIGSLFAHLGVDAGGVEKATPLTAMLETEIGDDMQARTARLALDVGRTMLDVDAKMAPVPLENASLRLSWRQGAPILSIDEMLAVSENTRVSLKGEIAPPAEGGDIWKITLADAGSTIEALTPKEAPIVFDTLTGAFSAIPAQRTLTFDKVDIKVGSGQASLSGRAYLDDSNRPGLALDLAVQDADARVGMRLWPGFAATEVRKWLAAHVRGGLINRVALKLDFPPDVFAAAISDKPLPDKSVAAAWTVSRGALQPLPGAPVINAIAGSGTATGRAVSMDVASAHIEMPSGRRLALSDGSFVISDVSKKPADARIRARLSGLVETALEYCKTPAVQPHVPKGIDKISAKGQIDGELAMALRISPRMTSADMQTSISAQLRNLSVDKNVSGQAIEVGTFQLNADRDAFSLKGEARLLGAQAQIDVKGAGKAAPVANIVLTMDDAARARQGINLPDVTGPVPVKLMAKLDDKDDEVTLEADLARLTITEIAPGVSKKAGVPGRLKALVNETDAGGWDLSKFELDFGQLSARGAVQIAPGGQSLKAQMASLKLSPGDAMQLDAERSANGQLKLSVRANSVDARPFLRSILKGSIDKTGGKDTELILKSTVLSGFNSELIANADVRMHARGGALQRFELSGRFDGGPISAKMQPSVRGPSTLTIATDDGGAFLRFFDIYARMRGGRMDLSAAVTRGGHTGSMTIRNFALRDEPALKRLVADQGPAGGTEESGRMSGQPGRRALDGQSVPFTRMTMGFVRTPGRLDIKDGLLIGPEVGGNVQGKLDFLRDSVDLTGTFVPAYSLNTIVANVPILGPIIAGGRHEGLFAIRYNITGRVSAPTLSLNPLTAIAPGFLRKLIDFRGNGGTGDAAPRPVN